MSVLVTGAAGFIGSHLCKALLDRGLYVIGVDNLSRGKFDSVEPLIVNPRFSFVEGDVRSILDLDQTVTDVEYIFHLASVVGGIGVYRANPHSILATNLEIDAAVTRFLTSRKPGGIFYASSAHVYPLHLQQGPRVESIMESDAYPALPCLTYGWSKLMGEQLIAAAYNESPTFTYAFGRLVGIYGPGQDIEIGTASVLPVIIRRHLEHPKYGMTFWGDGTEKRTYCYIDDCVDALLKIYSAAGDGVTLNCALNIGSEEEFSINELVSIVRELTEKKGLPEPTWDLARPATIEHQKCSILLAARELTWRPTTPMRVGLSALINDIKGRVQFAGY